MTDHDIQVINKWLQTWHNWIIEAANELEKEKETDQGHYRMKRLEYQHYVNFAGIQTEYLKRVSERQ